MSTDERPLIHVKWADAHGEGGVWNPLESASARQLVAQTVGWMVDQTKTELTLIQSCACHRDDEDAYFNSMTIPKGMVIEMHEIPGHAL